MNSINLRGPEFTFFPPGLVDGEAEYHARAMAGGVVFIRVGSGLSPVGFDVPRTVAARRGYAGDLENMVRDAIGQALRDGVFDAHPAETVYLDEDAPRWLGNLIRVEEEN